MYGEASDEIILSLEQSLNNFSLQKVNIYRNANSGKWIDIDSNWRFRVAPPHSGGIDTAKYHVHVEGIIGKNKVKSSEGVDGSKSHGLTMDSKKIPKWVQKKIKSSKQYKNGQEKQKKVKKAKSKIVSKKLNLKNKKDLTMSIAIFISIVGVTLFPPSALPSWSSVLLIL